MSTCLLLYVLSGSSSIGYFLQGRSVPTWAGEMACAKVPLDELQVTEPFGPQGKERTLPALVSEYCALHLHPA